MSSIDSVVLAVSDPDAAAIFYDAVFGVGEHLGFRAADTPAIGFRGFVLSLVVSQPSTVDCLFDTAVNAGATILKPSKKGFWGYGGVLRAPDGEVWKVAAPAA